MTIIEKIMNGSLDVFVEKGFDRSSISLITKGSGVSNGAIYHHFKSKDEIIKALFIQTKLEFMSYISSKLEDDQNIREKIYIMWSSIIKWSIDNHKKKKFMDMFISSPYYIDLDKSPLEGSIHIFNKVLEDGISLGYIVPLEIELFYCITMGSTDGYISYLLTNPDKNNHDFLKKYFNSYWRSIANI